MRLRPRVDALVRDTRGATITEYAILLFLVLVVTAAGWRLFGEKLGRALGMTASTLEAPSDSASSGAGGASDGKPAASAAAAVDRPPTGGAEGFGGARVAPKEKESSSLPKFALVALGIVGGAAAFFAMMKGKHAR